MTQNEYNVSGILGAKASAQNARALHHLDVTLGGKAPIHAIAERVALKASKAKREISKANPITWKLEPKHIQLRQAIIAKLGCNGLSAYAKGLDIIEVDGIYARELAE